MRRTGPTPAARLLHLAFAAAALIVALPALAAPARFDFYARGPYAAGVPKPSDVLGYEPGTFHTTWSGMEKVLAAFEQARPERIRREPFGRTVESRERSLFIVSSPENLAKLDAIREGNAKLADPRGVAAAEIERLTRELPVTVWLNYSIHGDESASFEAMMQVAYQLVAGDDSLTQRLLANAVVLMNPAHNPDGHERFVTWINAHGQGNPEHWALEQQRSQPWGIGGRRTHYQFDPNRDALAMSQPESRQMSREIRRWRPQVFVDHHGQTASFFFPPTSEPTNHMLGLADYRRWVERFGRGNAAAFDRYGWSYYVRDYFDFHATGYWDVWPTLQGAIGMTYETDGGGNLAYRRDDETVVTMRDGMARHFTASLATVETAVRFKTERLHDMAAFARASVTPAANAPRAYVLDATDDPVRAAALAENLQYAGVEVRWHPGPFTVRNARGVWADPGSRPAPAAGKGLDRSGTPSTSLGAAASRTFPQGAFVVDLAQPGSRIARALIEEDRSVDSAFARLELEKYERNVRRGRRAPSEGYNFYDITAWALPLSYGVPVYATYALPEGGAVLADPDPNAPDDALDPMPDSLAVGVPFTARASRVGPLIMRYASGQVAFDARGAVQGGEASTAYVWSCATDGASRLALRLLQEGYKVATAARPLRAGERDFPRGSFIARVERNPGTLHTRLAELARTSGVQVLAVNSAFADRGDTGVGSENIVSLKKPNIAVLVDGTVSPEAYGWLWFLLERRLGVRFTAVRANRVGGIELDRYNLIVAPDGGPGLAGSLGIGAIKDWVARGGTLICLDDAAELPTLANVGLSTAKVVGVPSKPKKDDEEIPDPDSSASEATRRPQYIPGTVFWATPDPRHWLTWGYGEGRIPVMLQGNTMLTSTREGANALRFDRVPLTVTGWTWPETERRLAHTVYAVDEPNGDGHVVMIPGPVLFRSYWRNTERLLTNALLYAPALE